MCDKQVGRAHKSPLTGVSFLQTKIEENEKLVPFLRKQKERIFHQIRIELFGKMKLINRQVKVDQKINFHNPAIP